MDENLLKQLFHWPADHPLRKPRFDKSLPPEPKALPAAGAQFLDESGYPKPWDLELRLNDLGLIVSVEKGTGERAGELWVTVRSTGRSHLGKEVRIGLIGSDDRIRMVHARIDREEANGCFGETRVGRLDEVRTELGDEITLSAFLLD